MNDKKGRDSKGSKAMMTREETPPKKKPAIIITVTETFSAQKQERERDRGGGLLLCEIIGGYSLSAVSTDRP
jgi:hypothetical protein